MSELSYAQHSVWFTERAGAAGDAYRMGLVIEFGPGLDERALREACAAVLERHRVLRAAVSTQDGVPRLTDATDKVSLADRVDDGPFDLECGPLTRLALVGRRLVLSAHHLVFDGESKDIFVRELAAAYNGAELGPPPPSQDDIVAAQREAVAALLPRAREVWHDNETRPDVVLPGLRPGSAAAGVSHEVRLTRAITDLLGPVADGLGVTRFELLLSAVHLLLARYGNEGVPVSVSLSTRTAQTRDTIGLFANDLPLAVVAGTTGTVAGYTEALRARLRGLYPLRVVPYSHVVGGTTRPAPALTPVSVSYRRQPHEPAFDGVDAVVDWSPPTGAARNLLHLLVVDAPSGLRLSLQHDPAILDAEAVARIGSHLVTVLTHMLDDPGREAAAIPILPDAERDLVVRSGNDTARVFPEATVPELFARQVLAHPDALAIVDGERRLSYAALDAASASIAAAVAGRGAGPGTRVAVNLPRSWQAVAALLGVMRAGAAYVPVDPAYPAMRREHVLADAAPVLVLDEQLCAEFLATPAAPMAPGSRPGDPAYVIYTSGSTGRPKGVVVPHSALANQLFALAELLGGAADARWLGLTSLSFDISVLELFLPLTTGAALVIAPDALDGAAVNRLVAAENVSHVQATPSGWRLLLDAGFASCDIAMSGGEALPQPLARELSGHARKLFNLYGPTEATIWSTVDDVGPGAVTIGRPLANTTAYVLDAAGQPAPVGLPGELHLGGAGLAEGYLGQPALTAQRFVRTALGRLYRTGDLCSWLPDGRLCYHGRADDQIKIRGHRVEPGEIVARLLEHPGVAEAAVTLRGERLVAYLVPVASLAAERSAPKDATAVVALDPAELRRHVGEALPSAMVPTHWVVLDRLPRTPNGKLDRAALPEPPPATMSDVDTTAPADELTAALTAMWQEVLGLPRVGPDDDLFDLGGHSLTITRINSRIGQRYGVQVPLDVFFDTPSIAEIAAYLRPHLGGA